MRTANIFLISMFLTGCAAPFHQSLDFEGFTVERGVYQPKDGWSFQPQTDGTVALMKDNGDSGGSIEPCDCAIEPDHTTKPGGSCDQATIEGDDGTITEIWCIDNGCGFCVGGTTTDPLGGVGGMAVKFRVECLKDRRFADTE